VFPPSLAGPPSSPNRARAAASPTLVAFPYLPVLPGLGDLLLGRIATGDFLLQLVRMACIPLKKVCPDHSRWKVKVRAVRFAEKFSNEQPPKLSRFEFIMLDEENVAMEAVIPPKWIDEQMAKLIEGVVYTVQYFEVFNARTIYRPVDHPYMARLTKHTRINRVDTVHPNFPVYACSITPFPVLRARVGIRDQMSDAMGLFTKCTRMAKQSTKHGVQSLINVHITDGRDSAALALWGSHAEKFDAQALMEMSKNGPVVLLFVGVTSNTFDGQLTLQCSTTCTWYVNPDLPETALLKQSFGSAIGQPYWIGEGYENRHQNTTVTDLAAIDNPHEAEGNKYKVTARVKGLVPNEQWWYLACTKCKRTTRPNGDSYKCYDNTCIGTGAVPRYKIPLIAIDPEAASDAEQKAIEIICFGAVGDEMVGLPADSLVSLGSDVQGCVPEQIKRMYGAKYDFTLSVPRGAIRFGRTTFRIDCFTRITELEEQATPQVTAPIGNTGTSEGIKSPGLAVQTSQTDQPSKEASTPVKDALDIAATPVIITPALPKEKRPIMEASAGEKLDDSDYETSIHSDKKPRAARKLSMNVSEDDE